MAKDPKRPNQDHWFDIANQIGSDSADELDDYFAGAAAEPLESIDSILREVEGDNPETDESQDDIQFDMSGSADQSEEIADEPAFAGFDQEPDAAEHVTVEAETKDPLDIDWGTPPKREYPKANKDESANKPADVSVPVFSEETKPVEKESKSSQEKKRADQPVRQKEQKPAADRGVDSWDLLANDLGIEKPWELEETIDEPELIDEEETVTEVSDTADADTPEVQSFDSIFDMGSDEADENKLSEEAAHDVLSQMFAFGDPNQDKNPVSETKSFDVSEDESDSFAAKSSRDNELGFDSFNSSKDTPQKNVDADSEADDDEEFIEFDVEALTDGEEAGRGRSRRRRGRRSNQNESSGRKEEDSSGDREDRKSAAQEKPASRRSRRSKDKTGSADSNKWQEKQSDQRSEDRPAKKPTESKSQKKEPISSDTDRKKKKIPTWGEAIDHLIDNNLASRKKSNNSGKKRRRR